MRKIIFGIIIGIFLTTAAVSFGAEKTIKIILDGREIYSDSPPVIINDRTFVPLRVISEALGIDVKWDSVSRAVILTSPKEKSVFKVLSYQKIDNENGYNILGELQNVSQKTFATAEIRAEVLDAGGNVINRLSSALPAGITPGETAYFRIRSLSGSEPVDSVNFSFSTADECSVEPADVAFNEIIFKKDASIYSDFTYVNGMLERKDKDFNRKYKNPVVQIAFFDENGRIVNYGEAALPTYDRYTNPNFSIVLGKGPAYKSYKFKCFSD